MDSSFDTDDSDIPKICKTEKNGNGKSSKELQELKGRYDTLCSKIKVLKEYTEKRDAEYKDIIKNLEGKLNRCEKDLNEKTKAIKTKDERMKELEKQLEDCCEKLKQRKKTTEEMKAKFNEKIQNLEEQIHCLRNELNEKKHLSKNISPNCKSHHEIVDGQDAAEEMHKIFNKILKKFHTVKSMKHGICKLSDFVGKQTDYLMEIINEWAKTENKYRECFVENFMQFTETVMNRNEEMNDKFSNFEEEIHHQIQKALDCLDDSPAPHSE